MPKNPEIDLTRRQRQIMSILYESGQSSVEEISALLPNSPSNTAVRTFLRILGEKGYVSRRKDGRRFLYRPKQARGRAALTSFRQTLDTFFEGSVSGAVAAHLTDPNADVDQEELQRLLRLIEDKVKGED